MKRFLPLLLSLLIMLPAIGAPQFDVKRKTSETNKSSKVGTPAPAPTLKVNGSSKPTVYFSASGGQTTLSISTNQGKPSISSLPSWVSTTAVSAKSITISCAANNSTSSRSGNFFVSAGKKSVSVSVQQDGSKAKQLEVKSMQFCNEDVKGNKISNIGSPLYWKQMRYLTPVLNYNGADREITGTVMLKVFRPDGTLYTSSSSNVPSGYSFTSDATFKPGNGNQVKLMGFGNRNGNAFVYTGNYRVEAYMDGKLIATATPYMSGSAPEKPTSMGITKFEFANVDKDLNIIDSWNTTLNGRNLQYLRPRITYTGPDSNVYTTLYVKIIKPDGSLVKGSDSPDGYTFKQDKTLVPGNNNILELLGYGNTTGTYYQDGGKYTVEIYADGICIGKQDITIQGVKNSTVKITGIDLANVRDDLSIINDYNSSLYTDEMRYLRPRINYNGLAYPVTTTLYVKIVKPDGTLITGSTSPAGYSYSQEVTFEEGAGHSLEIDGWGAPEISLYNVAGTYKCQIYNEGKLMGERTIYISAPRSSNNNSALSITGCSFANVYNDGSIINDFGSTLYADNMRYLCPRITYSNGKLKEAEVKVLIYNPFGELLGSNGSYTYKQEFTFYPGTNNKERLLAWGNQNQTTYVEGSYSIEIYVDGKRVYSTGVYLH